MNRKTVVLATLLFLSVGSYVLYFTDLLRPPPIVISTTSRPGRGESQPGAAMRVVFGLDREYSVEKVSVHALASGNSGTNREFQVWGLYATKGPAVTRGFPYGGNVDGLTSTAPSPEPLIPGVTYRIDVEAGRFRGTTQFIAREESGQ